MPTSPTRRPLLVGLLLATAGLAGSAPVRAAGTATGTGTGTGTVTIDNFSFTPAILTVPAGTAVTWINRDDIPHTIVLNDPVLAAKSSPLDTDDQFTFTFDKPRTYRYFCSLHPHMQGVVIVT